MLSQAQHFFKENLMIASLIAWRKTSSFDMMLGHV